jgi:hypothetical protein
VQGHETVVTTGSRPVPSEAVRETVTMALYVAVVLAAEFVAVEGSMPSTSPRRWP